MTPTKVLVFSFISFLLSLSGIAQNLYQGTFMTNDGQFGMQMKQVDTGIHGVLVANQTMYPVKGTKTSNGLKGMVYSEAGNYPFVASPIQGGWNVSSEGTSYYFYQISTEHELAGLDLSPYFKEGSIPNQNSSTSPSLPPKSKHGHIRQLLWCCQTGVRTCCKKSTCFLSAYLLCK